MGLLMTSFKALIVLLVHRMMILTDPSIATVAASIVAVKDEATGE